MRIAVLLIAIGSVAIAGDPWAESARAKLTLIKEDQAKPGSTVVLSERELNAWVAEELAEEPSLGLRQPKLTLQAGTVTFEVLADFGKLAGNNALVAQLLEGERPIKISAQPETGSGKILANLRSVEISGVSLTGNLLNLVAKLVLSQLFDDIEVDRPFDLGHNIDRAVIANNSLRIYLKK